MIQARATAKYVRTSAQKAGLVLALIRGKDVNQALKGVDAEVTGVRFEVPGECGSLLDSGFC